MLQNMIQKKKKKKKNLTFQFNFYYRVISVNVLDKTQYPPTTVVLSRWPDGLSSVSQALPNACTGLNPAWATNFFFWIGQCLKVIINI